MSEIKVGDRVTRPHRVSTREFKVEAISGEFAWLSFEVSDGIIRYITDRLTELSKVMPKFDQGGLYQSVSNPSSFVEVVAVNDEGAIGWNTNGQPWSSKHGWIDRWTKVGLILPPGKKSPESTVADKHSPLVECKIVTRHPEHYRLHNLHDRTQWIVDQSGTWIQVDPPSVPTF